MAIPKPSQTKQPILNYLARATEPVKLAVVIEEVGRHFKLTKEEMEVRMPSGMGRLAASVNAAAKEMKAARLLQSPRFGHLEITATGREGIHGVGTSGTAPAPTPQPAPEKEAHSSSVQPGHEQGTPKPKGKPGRKKKIDALPVQSTGKGAAVKPKGQPGRKKKIDSLPAQINRKEEVQVPQTQLVPASDDSRFLELTSDIVASYVSKTTIDLNQVPEFIKSTHAALAGLGQPASNEPAASQKPAVPIEESVTGDYIICLEDGKRLKFLKRHIREKYKLSPVEYRLKWGLSPDYPMVAPSYAEERSKLSKTLGLGRKPGALQKKTA